MRKLTFAILIAGSFCIIQCKNTTVSEHEVSDSLTAVPVNADTTLRRESNVTNATTTGGGTANPNHADTVSADTVNR